MKKFLACLLASIVCSSVAMADVYVRGYTRSDGTYVAPHYRSSPNATRNDNWTTRGNVNPYTGAALTTAMVRRMALRVHTAIRRRAMTVAGAADSRSLARPISGDFPFLAPR